MPMLKLAVRCDQFLDDAYDATIYVNAPNMPKKRVWH